MLTVVTMIHCRYIGYICLEFIFRDVKRGQNLEFEPKAKTLIVNSVPGGLKRSSAIAMKQDVIRASRCRCC